VQPGPDTDARLLIVDDEVANVRLLEHTLRLAGYDHLHATTDSRQALTAYHEIDPDLVLLDLAMPHLDGFEVMARLREAVPDHAYLPILVLTADTSTQAKQRALAAGANDFLLKPLDLVEVVLRIANLLHTRRLHLELEERNRQLEHRVRERTAELHQRAEALERTTSDLAQFARAASHELAEPLRMVASHVQLLARRHADRLGDDADHIRFAVEGTTRMHSLLGDLLAYTQAATADPARVPVALDGVVADVLRRLDGLVSRAGATVAVDPLPTVSADPAQLTQVLLHLVDNAVKFHAPGRRPSVRVGADRGVQGWRISVADDGIGIAPHHAERLFTLFQRLHHRDQYPGNGIGLVLCKRLVEHHGGRIWVDPGPDGGTVVTFTIPDPG
jgi:signal transduction histidine kinase